MTKPLATTKISRRDALKGIAGTGALVLGVHIAPKPTVADTAAAGLNAGKDAVAPNVFVALRKDGSVTIVAHRSEMGQGVRTSLPQIVADEMEADWNRVSIVQAEGDEKYGSQNTDGSRSVRRFYTAMREAGATMRTLLERAAAQEWDVPAGECRAVNHEVVHIPSGRKFGFGDLALKARELDVPPAEELTLKKREDFRYVGTDVRIVDMADMTHGRARYGIDMHLEGMKYACIVRPPALFGKVKSHDAAEAMKVKGVEKVVPLPAPEPPAAFKPLGGLAVIAGNTWAAMEGCRKLKIDWEEGPNASYTSADYRTALLETARKPGKVVRQRGDAGGALKSAEKTLEAEYYAPHLAQAPMEPPNATARIKDGKCEVWAPTQHPQAARSTVAEALGMEEKDVTVNVTLLGGGFGRKSKPDFVVEAALLAKELGAPVKVTWTRTDDLHHSYFHSVSAQRIEAGLDGKGRITAWKHRTVFPSISATFQKDHTHASEGELSLGFVDMPFDIPNIRMENGEARAHTRIGWLRSVANIYHAFAMHSFLDELAREAGRDPKDFLLTALGEPRKLDPKEDGANYTNYGDPMEVYPIDTGRMRAVVELAAEKAKWGKKLRKGEGMGIAVHRSFLTYVAAVVHAAVDGDGELTVKDIHMGVDCGTVVNPDRVRSQMEGAAVYGLSCALEGEITLKDGAVQQNNFDTYRVARMNQSPDVHVHIVESEAAPAGVGEPGVPPIAPALCNAIFDATGKRIRTLPIAGQLRT
ncbi:MAG: molybdopterin cofactor-binding domain-containing protein [bacterium]